MIPLRGCLSSRGLMGRLFWRKLVGYLYLVFTPLTRTAEIRGFLSRRRISFLDSLTQRLRQLRHGKAFRILIRSKLVAVESPMLLSWK